MIFRKLDYISSPIYLFYKGESSHSSVILGLLTIAIYIVFLVFSFLFLSDFYTRKNTTSYYVSRFVEDAGIYTFNYSTFFHYIFLTKKGSAQKVIDFDFDAFRVFGLQSKLHDNFLRVNPMNLSQISHWLYGPCNSDKDTSDHKEIIRIGNISKAACIKKFFNPNKNMYFDLNDKNYESPNLKHGMANVNYSFYNIIIQRCKDDDLRAKAGYGKCKKDIEIDQVIGGDVLYIDFLDYYPEIVNYDNPFRKYFYTLNSMLNTNTFTVTSLNFNPAMLSSNNGIFSDNYIYKYSYIFLESTRSKNNEAFELKDNQGKTLLDENGNAKTQSSGLVYCYYFYLQNRLQHYERSYQKMHDVLAIIGGLSKIVAVVMEAMNILFCKFNVLLDTQDFLFSIKKTKKIKYVKNINAMNDSALDKNLILFNDKKSEEEIKSNNYNIKKKEKENKNRKMSMFISKTAFINIFKNKNSDSVNEIKKEYRDINNKILKRPNKKYHFYWFQYIWYILKCSKFNEKIGFYEKFRSKIISEENIFISHFNLYKLINILEMEKNEELFLDKKYTTVFE